MKNGVEQDIENIESFYDVEKNIYNIAKILKNQDVNNISNLVNKLDKRKIVICRKDGIYVWKNQKIYGLNRYL